MNIILDVQGFKIENNKFIVKELAAFDGVRVSHFIFKSPFRMDYLSPDLHKQAEWLMRNHHCIDWREGFTPLHKFGDIIKSLCNKVDYVYVKGKEKSEFIKKFTITPVIEIDEQPTLKPRDPSCFFHLRKPCFCALSNVYYLYDQIFM
jgi:hypothetical protein